MFRCSRFDNTHGDENLPTDQEHQRFLEHVEAETIIVRADINEQPDALVSLVDDDEKTAEFHELVTDGNYHSLGAFVYKNVTAYYANRALQKVTGTTR